MTLLLPISRRALFSAAAVAAPTLFLPRRVAAAEFATVRTANGTLRGLRDRNAVSFKGIPYAADTGGKNRFMAPRPPASWTGVRDALTFGDRCVQARRPGAPAANGPAYSENCCVLNVYTPSLDSRARCPVMVYFHGGGFRAGSGDAPDLDGVNLAVTGGVVVVTLNHRLNIFGYANLAFLDAGFADAPNAGQLDLIAALKWVTTNIAQFGGDAGNITIFGQSGGGSKCISLQIAPSAAGLFRRSINMSGSSGFGITAAAEREPATLEMLRNLGIARADVHKLQDVPAETLLAAHDRAVVTVKGGDARPVVDGRHIFHGPLTPQGVAMQAALPSILSNTATEATVFLGNQRSLADISTEQVQARIAKHYKVDPARAAAIMDSFRQEVPTRTPWEVLSEIASEALVTMSMRRGLELRARAGRAPVFAEEFAWRTPVDNGMWGSPHSIDIPCAFGNTDKNRLTAPGGPGVLLASRAEMAAFAAFAHTGNPNNPHMPEWLPYDFATRPAMVVDAQCRLVNDVRAADRKAAEALPIEDSLAVTQGPLFQGA